MASIIKLSPQNATSKEWNSPQYLCSNEYNEQNRQNTVEKEKKTIDMETTVMDMKEFEEYFEIADMFKSPNNHQQLMVNDQNLNISNNNQSYSEMLRSPDRNEITFRKMGNYSCSTASTDDLAPLTSTPERKPPGFSNKKYKIHRPPDLIIDNSLDDDCNYNTINDVAQCSPVKSPFPLSDSLDDSLLGLDDTLLPVLCNPPALKVIGFNVRERKMMSLLQRFGLSHWTFIFLEQEVDVDLFLTLNDNDLKEIGIAKNSDRNIILSVIAECNRRCQLI